MAMMATQGVGIFSQKHFSIDRMQKASLVSAEGTHVATWAVLEEWAGHSQAADLLGRILTPRDTAMSDWLAHFSLGAAWQPMAEDWLRVMGLDIQRLSADRDARNEASYRPTQLNPCMTNSPEVIAQFARDIWLDLEPTGISSFGNLDRHLLRLTLELAFKSSTGRSSKQASTRFRTAVAHTVSENINGDEENTWNEYLTRQTDPSDSPILLLARQQHGVESSTHHMEAISRALIFLRFASGSVRIMLEDAGIDFDDLAFWWHTYGTDRGMWLLPPHPSQLYESWADAESALEELSTWDAGTAKDTVREMLTACPSAMTWLGGMEMVGLWSIAS